uniref:Cytochrome P450 1A n=1 Tax=Rhinopithecus roxellana TaxID=61622 RepID=A0A2K6PHN4_RHIRO
MALSQSVPFSATELLLASAIFCLVFWVLRGSRPRVLKGLKSPPEPWGWPLLGHVLTLGKNPHLALSKMSQLYGDMLQIRIGSTPVLVLSSLDTIRQALVRQGDNFKGRPDLYSFTFITDGQSMSFSPDSGPVWAARRHLAQKALNTFSIASDPASGGVEQRSAFDLGSARDTSKRVPPQNSVQDITGALFKHSKKGPRASGNLIPQEKIVNLVNDIFGAGFDTIATAISWSLMYLVARPEIQRKIQKELDAVIGRGWRSRLSDRPQLPYLEAFILETFRHSSFALSLTVPSSLLSTTRDTTLNGFYIPRECCVFINQWQVNHNPELWGDPSEFRPEGTTINKPLSEKIMLFGLGKRRCIGEVLGKWEVFLFLAILLQQLEFSLPPGVKVNLTPIYELTMKHAHCEHFQVRLRFSIK